MPIALNDGLIGYWSLNKGTGVTAFDKSVYGNHGTLEGTTPTWVDGQSGSAVNFPGVNERIDCGNGAPLDDLGSGDFSISFWMKSLDAVPNTYGVLFGKYPDGVDGILVDSYIANNRMRFFMRKGGSIVSSPFSVGSAAFDTNWNHIAVVINRTIDKSILYINKVKDATEIDLSTLPNDCSNAANISWGARHEGASPYEGRLDECRVYDRLLTTDEIDYLHDHPGGNIAIQRRRRS